MIEVNSVYEKVLNELKTFIGNTSFNESFCDDLLKRLKGFNYIIIEEDSYLLCNTIKKVERYVQGFCNIKTVTYDIYDDCINIICGEFLFEKKQIGQLDENFNIEQVVKSVALGDGNVTFQNNEKEDRGSRINTLITYLLNSKNNLTNYRKVRW